MHSYPKLPKSRKENHKSLKLMDLKTNTGELFIYNNDVLNEIVIFSCRSNIDFF